MGQYGFRVNGSTFAVLLDVSMSIRRNLDKSGSLKSVLELKEAFGNQSRRSTTENATIGVRDIPNQLFNFYLSSLCQLININGKVSHRLHISTGVPQGSKLGLFLHILCGWPYEMIRRSKWKLCFIWGWLQTGTRKLHPDLIQVCNSVNIWLKCNILCLNTPETIFLIFGEPKQRRHFLKLLRKIYC